MSLEFSISIRSSRQLFTISSYDQYKYIKCKRWNIRSTDYHQKSPDQNFFHTQSAKYPKVVYSHYNHFNFMIFLFCFCLSPPIKETKNQKNILTEKCAKLINNLIIDTFKFKELYEKEKFLIKNFFEIFENRVKRFFFQKKFLKRINFP